MKILFYLSGILFIFISGVNAQDAVNCKDSPLFKRMPHTIIEGCSSNYDELAFPVSSNASTTKEGNITSLQYIYDSKYEVKAPSFSDIVNYYENAAVKNGGKKIYFDKGDGVATLFAKYAGIDTWILLNDLSKSQPGNYALVLLEIGDIRQQISSSEMSDALSDNGRFDLYISFENGSVIKPESKNIVDHLTELLRNNTELNVGIEGHTNNSGNAKSDMTLSESRSLALMNALIANGIDKGRLTSKGWGQTKPVSDNNTEEGKAKNRRIEIIKLKD